MVQKNFSIQICDDLNLTLNINSEATLVGIRHKFTADDIPFRSPFPNADSVSTKSIELRETILGSEFHYPIGGCQISPWALRFAPIPNLPIAGRCLSATHEAQAALRVIGTALATGEAAGKLAMQTL